eukprot:Hpha_TRINITY_DN24430_c0_g1::TRINITY_DN24430_c0_g1_i1::g.165687::m.165687
MWRLIVGAVTLAAPGWCFDASLQGEVEECSACAVFTWELAGRLSTENERDDLDLAGHAGRVSGTKKTPKKWMGSELRATELLESLCDGVFSYTVPDTPPEAKDVPAPVPRAFARVGSRKKSAAEKQSTHRLRVYCENLVGEQDEWLEELIGRGTGIGAGDVEALGHAVCIERTKACATSERLEELLPWTDQYYQQKLRLESQKGPAIAVEARAPDGSKVEIEGAINNPKKGESSDGEL